MKILVTGGSGLVGHALSKVAPRLSKYNIIFMSSRDCDLFNFSKTCSFINNISPDVVIHLAANVGGLFKNLNQKVNMFESNILMNMNILRACYNSGVKQFIGALSTCIFPDSTSYPIDESMLHSGPPHASNDAYAYAKRMLKVQCDAYNEQYDTNYSCIIPTNLYGENDNYSLEDAHVIPALIHKCYIAKQKGSSFIVAGSGKPLRQFLHAEDLATIILNLIPKLEKDSVIISGDEEISIGDVATFIARAFDYETQLEFDTDLSDGQYKKTANNCKLNDMIGHYNFIKAENGINRTVDYFIQNYPNLRI